MTKRQIKAAYKSGKMFLSEAVELLMFDFSMMRGEAINYLEK